LTLHVFTEINLIYLKSFQLYFLCISGISRWWSIDVCMCA